MAFCHTQHLALLQGAHCSFALKCIFEQQKQKTKFKKPKQAVFIKMFTNKIMTDYSKICTLLLPTSLTMILPDGEMHIPAG
jgi:hypothetical protein